MDPYQPPSAELSEPATFVEERFRPIPVLVCALLVDVAGTLVLGSLFAIPFMFGLIADGASELEIEAALMADPGYNLVSMVIGASLTVLAGLVGARWAGNQHLKHGLAVGTVSAALGIALLLMLPEAEGGFFPMWVTWLSAVATVPLGGLGGWLAQGSR